MNRTLHIWQLDNWPIANIPLAVAEQGFNRVAVKALDGTDWMKAFDKSSDAIGSIADCRGWVKAFNDHGIACDFWVNVVGSQSITDQARLIRQLVNALPGRVILDLEPYQHFWGDESSLDPLYRALHNEGVSKERLGISFDPRRMSWIVGYLGMAQWLMPQIYDPSWVSFLHAVDSSRSLWEPMLDTERITGTPTLAAEWSVILRDSVLGNEGGRSGFGIWRAPVTDPAQLDAIKVMA